DLEHRAALGTNDGVAAEGVEMDSRGEGLGDLRCRDDGGERATVPDPFSHGDDIRHDALSLEPPKLRSCATEARLYLVRDAQAARGPHVTVGVAQVAVGENDRAANALNGLREEAGDLSRRAELNEAANVLRVLAARFRIVLAVGAAVRVRHHGVLHPKAVRHVE